MLSPIIFPPQEGMAVQCCQTYREVEEGDVGRIVKLERDGLHACDLLVDWQRKGGLYWVKY